MMLYRCCCLCSECLVAAPCILSAAFIINHDTGQMGARENQMLNHLQIIVVHII